MGNRPSIPHLQDESSGSKKERRSAQINNHIRTLLWDWWYAAEDKRGVYVELRSGLRKLIKDMDYVEASKRPSVKKVLLFSNNGEDLNLFIEWVADEAPKKMVDNIMARKSTTSMIDYVWKHGLRREDGKVWRLRTS